MFHVFPDRDDLTFASSSSPVRLPPKKYVKQIPYTPILLLLVVQ